MSNRINRNQAVIQEFRQNQGKVGGYFANMDLLLLHTTGARSGQSHVNPVATMRDGNRYIIIASKGGAPSHPDWYHNLVAHPTVRVEVGADEFEAKAEVLAEPERSEAYNRMAAQYPGFAEYEPKTDRVIPVIVLHPVTQQG